MHRCVSNPPQADLITAAMYVINLARHRKLDELGRIAAAAIAIVVLGKTDSIFIWGRL
jgi:hypothetical protein